MVKKAPAASARKAKPVKKAPAKAPKLTESAWIRDDSWRPTPGQVRAKLRALMTGRGMKAAEVRALIGGSGASWSKLMGGSYKGGVSGAVCNETYQRASFFFWKEKQLGAVGQLAAVAGKAKARATAAGKKPFPDISRVKTDGKTYLTPKEVRRELNRITKTFKVTQADLAKRIGVSSLGKFMGKGGEFGGEESDSYHPLAQLCEKVRIATGRPKSKKRLGLEQEAASGRKRRQPFLGVNPNRKMLLSADEVAYAAKDNLGRTVIKIVERKR